MAIEVDPEEARKERWRKLAKLLAPDEGEGDEPDDDKDVELFPAEPTEVIVNPTLKQTENRLEEALNRVLYRVARQKLRNRMLSKCSRRLRKNYDDGVVPLRNAPLTKEQKERLACCHAVMALINEGTQARAKRVWHRISQRRKRESVIEDINKDPILLLNILKEYVHDIDLKS